MSRYRLVSSERSAEDWDRFVAGSNDGTLFHTRGFLSYHGDRFADGERFLEVHKGETLIGVIPVFVADDVRSPYGASVGGFAMATAPSYSAATQIAAALIDWLREQAAAGATLTLAPSTYQRTPDDTLLFCLLEAGFVQTNAEVVHLVPLDRDLAAHYEGRCRTAIRKAERAGVVVRQRAPVADFWRTLQATYAKHGTGATHSEAQWRWLCDRLGDRVWCDVAYLDGEPVAGVGHMQLNDRVASSFYLSVVPERRHSQAQSLLIDRALEAAQASGATYFDFGTSSVNMVGRESVFRFKESFGAVARFRQTIRWTA